MSKLDVDGIIDLHLRRSTSRWSAPVRQGQFDDLFYALNSLTRITEILSNNEFRQGL